jgi:hypothetical protein
MNRAVVVLIGVAVAAACARETADTSSPSSPQVEAQASAEAAGRSVLAEATNRTPPVGVQVVDARRVAVDTLRLEIVVSNLAAVAAPPSDLLAVQSAVAALAGLSIVTADGRRRFFPLHDSAGRMAWSGLEPPAPGQRRSFWVLFPVPEGGTPVVTLALPGLAPVPGIVVSKGSGVFSDEPLEKTPDR